jgi:hypothetical protein
MLPSVFSRTQRGDRGLKGFRFNSRRPNDKAAFQTNVTGGRFQSTSGGADTTSNPVSVAEIAQYPASTVEIASPASRTQSTPTFPRWDLAKRNTSQKASHGSAGRVLRRLTGDLVRLIRVEILGVFEEVIGVPMITVLLPASRTDEVCERFLNRPHIGLAKEHPESAPVFL